MKRHGSQILKRSHKVGGGNLPARRLAQPVAYLGDSPPTKRRV
jgi:hypothetical protein